MMTITTIKTSVLTHAAAIMYTGIPVDVYNIYDFVNSTLQDYNLESQNLSEMKETFLCQKLALHSIEYL